MCEREYDYHRFNNEYVYPQYIQDKEILDKLYSEYGRNFRLLSGIGSGKKVMLYVQCEYGELIYYFDKEYSNREWNLKLLRENKI